MREIDFFERYTRNTDPEKALALLRRPHQDNPPIEGDELPEGWAPKRDIAAAIPKPRKATRSKSRK